MLVDKAGLVMKLVSFFFIKILLSIYFVRWP